EVGIAEEAEVAAVGVAEAAEEVRGGARVTRRSRLATQVVLAREEEATELGAAGDRAAGLAELRGGLAHAGHVRGLRLAHLVPVARGREVVRVAHGVGLADVAADAVDAAEVTDARQLAGAL